MNELLDAALVYAAHKWPVFPCNQEKRPLTPHGFKDATTDPDQIRAWWEKWPTAAIGVPTGKVIQAWVLDVDLPKGDSEQDGVDTLSEMEIANGILPDTKRQRTGSGGYQYFFDCSNGLTVKNNARTKLGPGLDIRGDGGYVIVPPSENQAGKYQWLSEPGTHPAPAPEWLLKLVKDRPTKIKPITTTGTTPYGEAALRGEMSKMLSIPEGARNVELNGSCYVIGQLVPHEVNHDYAFTSLVRAGVAVGLTQREAEKTVSSGMKAGMEKPRFPEHSDNSDVPEHSDTLRHFPTSSDILRHPPTSSDTSDTQERKNFGNSLRAEIEGWIRSSTGYFTNDQIDREFGIKTRTDKRCRSDALRYIEKNKGIISKDIRVAGKWHILSTDVDFFTISQIKDISFEISLPFDLSDKIRIPPKGVVVLAGSSNAGKTALILNTIKLNLGGPHQQIYLLREGVSEYARRVRQMDAPEEWEAVKIAECASGFSNIIRSHNATGITYVDFLREVDGEYFRIASDIQSVADALTTGVSFVAIQKATGATFGRGGEATQEAARLYLSLDKLLDVDCASINSLKIIKAKDYGKYNPNGQEIHFKISGGVNMEPISKWMRVDDKQRKTLVEQYKRQHGNKYQEWYK